MESQLTYIIIYICLLLLLVLFFLNKNKWKVSITSILLGFNAFSAICSLLYYNAVTTYGLVDYSNIALCPFLYLILGYLITIYPVAVFETKSTKLRGIRINTSQSKFLDLISILAVIASIEPFIETIFRFIPMLSNLDSFGSAYMNSKAHGGEGNIYLSFIGRKFYFVILLLELIIPILLAYQLSRRQRNKKIILGLIVPIITIWMNTLITGGRSGIVQGLLYYIVIYFIFRQFFNNQINKIIIKNGLLIGAFAITGISIMTISRFAQSSGYFETVWVWLGLYAGEAPLNFNSIMWDVAGSTNGDRTFILLKVLLGLTEDYSLDAVWETSSRLGIPGNIFYTYIGAIFYDFNKVGTIIFLLVFSLVTRIVTNIKGHKVQIYKLILICLSSRILIAPMFYTYGTFAAQQQLMISFIICGFLMFYEMNNKKL